MPATEDWKFSNTEVKINKRSKISELVRLYSMLDAQYKSIQKNRETVKEFIVKYMDTHEVNKLEYDGVSLTKVDVDKLNVNEAVLKTLIPNRLFKSLQIPAISVDLFKLSVKKGDIDIDKVKEAISYTHICRLTCKESK